MMDLLNWIAQDSQHVLGTAFFIWLIGGLIARCIHGGKS